MEAIETIRQMSLRELAALGLSHVAYVKPVSVDGKTAYSIHAADGTEMAVMGDRDVAVTTIRVHNLEPLSVH
ncbi:MAG TPA: DUF1150 family protein [Alphaproteobacteria bacterium]|jgi:hypothetical protein|nr:DUF1150 family protein [Alphaproteobacteria bacterium]